MKTYKEKKEELLSIFDDIKAIQKDGQEGEAFLAIEIVQTQIMFEHNEILERIALSLEAIKQVGLKTRTK